MFTFSVILFYIVPSGVSLLFCHVFFVLFYLYQRRKDHTLQSLRNDDFLLTFIGLTIQIGNIHSLILLFTLLSGQNNQFVICVLFNIRAVNAQVQFVLMLFLSITRFAKLFFPHKFSVMNQYLIGSVMKVSVVLVPAYINFVLGHTCGQDVFCPKDLRKSVNLIRYTDWTTYGKEIQSLILKNLECRITILKTFIPILILIILLANLCIMTKHLVHYFQTKASPPPSQSMELSTVSAAVDLDQSIEDGHPQSSNIEEPYSVGVMAGVFTIMAIMSNRLAIFLTMYERTNYLKFALMELITSFLVPLLWSLTNTQILISSFRASQQT